MRLIDADALCVHIEEEFDGVCVYDVSGNEAAREFCDMVGIAPTIDAIPVDWIMKWSNKRYQETQRDVSIVDVLAAWQKEQEAQDE